MPPLPGSRRLKLAVQAMLYGAGVPNRDKMKNAPQVGIATVWWQGNPCK